MSKLLDTLEKIRKNEDVTYPTKKKGSLSTGDTSRKTNIKFVAVMAFVIIALSIYGGLPYITQHIIKIGKRPHTQTKTAKSPIKKRIEPTPHHIKKARKPPIVTSKQAKEFAHFNKLALQHIHNNQPWKGVYYFQKANIAEPKRIEPLINMAVTYAELGYYTKAIELFEKAYGINPHSPPLLKNLNILKQANLLKSNILPSGF